LRQEVSSLQQRLKENVDRASRVRQHAERYVTLASSFMHIASAFVNLCHAPLHPCPLVRRVAAFPLLLPHTASSTIHLPAKQLVPTQVSVHACVQGAACTEPAGRQAAAVPSVSAGQA
jgi:hypothetical protein